MPQATANHKTNRKTEAVVMAGKGLTARAAATAKPGRYGDGRGLYLVVSASGAKKWVFRFTRGGHVTEMGLGAAALVGLADARERANEARKLVASGINPIEARRRAESQKPTFGQMADSFIEAKSSEWGEKHLAQWRMMLGHYAAPLRNLPVDEVTTEAVLGVLQPIWQTKHETASRLRGKIEAVLDAAAARGLRSGPNVASWRGHLSHLLARRSKLEIRHHGALDYRDIPSFLATLREHETVQHLAVEFVALTATRSGEALGARWNEFDLAEKTWVIPEGRMKAHQKHRVPLTERVMEILDGLAPFRSSDGDFVFPGRRPGGHMSGAALRRCMPAGTTIHGLRATFRTWAAEETSFAREVAEQALAHSVGNAVERSYARGDLFERRRALMEAWVKYCEPAADSNVVAIGAR
jgi:integrase